MSDSKPIALMMCASHFSGAGAMHAVAAEPRLKVVFVASDDPYSPTLSPRRLWRLSKDPSIVDLVPNLARTMGLEAHLGSIGTPDFFKRLSQHRPSAILTCCYGRRIPKSIIEMVGGRAYNVHPIIPGMGLDETRGVDPLEKAVVAGRGLQMVIHRMSERYDDGEILAWSEYLPFPPRLTADNLDPALLLAFWRDTSSIVEKLITKNLLRLIDVDLLPTSVFSKNQTG